MRGVRAERVENVLEALQCVSDGLCIMPTSMVSQPAQYRYRYNNLEFVPGDMPAGHSHFIFAKNSPLMREFNLSLTAQRPRLVNILARYFKSLYRQKKATYRGSSDNDAVISTRLYPYAGLLLSCGAVYLMAIAIFAYELLFTRYKTQKERSARGPAPLQVHVLRSASP
ncbi:hypothetical protein AAVH_18052 [Aphelenchoides avenae]|nr:hypothetical protein AAVH_18052 [Aphelenchus avenae]